MHEQKRGSAPKSRRMDDDNAPHRPSVHILDRSRNFLFGRTGHSLVLALNSEPESLLGISKHDVDVARSSPNPVTRLVLWVHLKPKGATQFCNGPFKLPSRADFHGSILLRSLWDHHCPMK